MKNNVLVSIDTEAPLGNQGFEKLILGITKSGEYGVDYLMDVFNKYYIKGLFFVDLAEVWVYGFEKFSGLLNNIVAKGHDVGVHLHPDRMMDNNRKFLWQYSYNEQYEMIKKCTDLYCKILNKRPLAFRAGRYGANDDTIQILSELGYKYDSSFFFGNKNCHIRNINTINSLVEVGGLLEIPVTSFNSFKFFNYSRQDKVDFSMPISEFKYVMNNVEEDKDIIISYFLHSFSLLNWRNNPANPKVNKYFVKKLDNELKWASNNLSFISIDDVKNKNCVNVKNIYCTKTIRQYIYFFIRAFKVLKDRIIRNI